MTVVEEEEEVAGMVVEVVVEVVAVVILPMVWVGAAVFAAIVMVAIHAVPLGLA